VMLHAGVNKHDISEVRRLISACWDLSAVVSCCHTVASEAHSARVAQQSLQDLCQSTLHIHRPDLAIVPASTSTFKHSRFMVALHCVKKTRMRFTSAFAVYRPPEP
jgi:hypothetical protein